MPGAPYIQSGADHDQLLPARRLTEPDPEARLPGWYKTRKLPPVMRVAQVSISRFTMEINAHHGRILTDSSNQENEGDHHRSSRYNLSE